MEIPAENDDFERLEFPEEGKLFIHGFNEAGKSTFFESIYFALFGTALVPDRSKSSMSELLAYDRDKGVVELEFVVQDSLYRIRRTIEESGNSMSYRHELVIEHQDKDPEGIKGARNVNKRIEQELGLDGDALLNSCFVQQKNMDRLEDSQRSKREESVAKLLNLDRFTSMENDYSSKQDTASDELERAQQKKEIAEIEEEEIPEKVEEKEEVESKLQVIEWKQEIKKLEDDIDDAENRIEERIDEVHGLANEIQEIQKLKNQLPEKKERKQDLDQLYSDFQNLEELDYAISNMDDLESLDKEIEQLDSKISDLEDERDQLSDRLDTVREKLEKYEYLDLLDDWKRLKKAATREERIEGEEKKQEKKRKQAEEKLEEFKKERSETAGRRKAVLGAGGGVSVVTLIIGALISPFAFVGVLLGLGIAAYGYVNYDPGQYDSQIDSLDEEVSTHEKELTKLEGQREDMKETEAEDPSEELKQAESEIEKLDRTIPSTPDECSGLQNEVEKALEDSLDQDELELKKDELSDKLSRKKEKISSKKDELGGKQGERKELDKERIRERINSLKKEIVGEGKDRDEIEAGLKERAEKLDVEQDKQKVNSTKSSLQTEIDKDKEKIGKLDEIEGQIDQKNEKIDELQRAISEASSGIDELEGKIEKADSNPDIDQESKLEKERDDIIGSLRSLRDKRDELREELGISEDLNLENVEEEADEKRHEVKLYRYAENIVSESKKRIMENILPKTEANMARFLPILTNGRYKDVRIDSDSFKIEAYDGRAQAYKSKSIFSGGTKDQFSLALRLSFAMATLPQERGTAPDFLYLDEPVGSFDPSRQEALTELLTRGEIAENFGQIFIVSHVQGLKEQFDNHIEMGDGQIAEIEMEG